MEPRIPAAGGVCCTACCLTSTLLVHLHTGLGSNPLTHLHPSQEALSLTPVFLQATGNDHDLKDWQLPLGRRFR